MIKRTHISGTNKTAPLRAMDMKLKSRIMPPASPAEIRAADRSKRMMILRIENSF